MPATHLRWWASSITPADSLKARAFWPSANVRATMDGLFEKRTGRQAHPQRAQTISAPVLSKGRAPAIRALSEKLSCAPSKEQSSRCRSLRHRSLDWEDGSRPFCTRGPGGRQGMIFSNRLLGVDGVSQSIAV